MRPNFGLFFKFALQTYEFFALPAMSSRSSPILPLTAAVVWSQVKPSNSQATSVSSRHAGGRRALGGCSCSQASQLRQIQKHPKVNAKTNVAKERNYTKKSNARNENGIRSSFSEKSDEQQSEHEEEDRQDEDENTLSLQSPGHRRKFFTVTLSSELSDERKMKSAPVKKGKRRITTPS